MTASERATFFAIDFPDDLFGRGAEELEFITMVLQQKEKLQFLERLQRNFEDTPKNPTTLKEINKISNEVVCVFEDICARDSLLRKNIMHVGSSYHTERVFETIEVVKKELSVSLEKAKNMFWRKFYCDILTESLDNYEVKYAAESRFVGLDNGVIAKRIAKYCFRLICQTDEALLMVDSVTRNNLQLECSQIIERAERFIALLDADQFECGSIVHGPQIHPSPMDEPDSALNTRSSAHSGTLITTPVIEATDSTSWSLDPMISCGHITDQTASPFVQETEENSTSKFFPAGRTSLYWSFMSLVKWGHLFRHRSSIIPFYSVNSCTIGWKAVRPDFICAVLLRIIWNAAMRISWWMDTGQSILAATAFENLLRSPSPTEQSVISDN